MNQPTFYFHEMTPAEAAAMKTAPVFRHLPQVGPSTNFMELGPGPFRCIRCKSEFQTKEAVDKHFGTNYTCSGKPEAWIIQQSRINRKLGAARARRDKLNREQITIDRVLGISKILQENVVLKARIETLTKENKGLNEALTALKAGPQS